MDTSDLDVVFSSDGFESCLVLGELGKSDVDGGAEGGTEVGGAGGDVTKVLVVGELGDLLDAGGGAAESVEDGVDVRAVLHGDNSELVLLVDPDKESLGIVVEDTSARGPVSVGVASFEESVSFPKNGVLRSCE